MEEKHPFDLSSVIEALQSIPSYPSPAYPQIPPEAPDAKRRNSVNTPVLGFDYFAKTGYVNVDDSHVDTNKETARLMPSVVPKISSAPAPAPSPPRGSSKFSVSIAKKLTDRSESLPKKRTTSDLKYSSAAYATVAFWPALRRVDLIEKMREDFDDFDPHSYLPHQKKSSSPSAIHVFVDYSNISIAFYESARKLYGHKKIAKEPFPNISFHNLSLILERGRTWAKKVLVGSTKNTWLADEARSLNYEVNILRRVPKDDGLVEVSRKNKEQCVDEIIILKMMESLVDCVPSTIVLATGDGNITDFSDGFFKAVERCLACGWKVEVIAFQRSLSKSWKRLSCSQFRVILLDRYLLNLI